MKKFTFKTEKPTGRYSSFFPTRITIKLSGKKVGTIYESGKIGFCIKKKDLNEDKNLNCPWRWFYCKSDTTNLEDAKAWVIKNDGLIQRSLDIFSLD
ncbi:MAG: hypothetical protein MUF12_09210 [Sediminibacterium sp.]|nr:hypothetical protein [Sediminibacterium sp.]